jgi:CubicO group peptidase (beta-lactamase class C family)
MSVVRATARALVLALARSREDTCQGLYLTVWHEMGYPCPLRASNKLGRAALRSPLALVRIAKMDAAALSTEDLQSILAKAMEGSKVPAMGLLLIRNGKVDAEAVRGVRRNDGADPVQIGDPWHLGSDGKAMTATMVARLVDQGVLSWTKPLDEMLPELAATMQPQYRKVTLIQLLSHHSGLPHDIIDEKVLQALFLDKTSAPLSQKRLTYVARALQDSPVGPTTASSYSNTGLIIAAVIAERTTGVAYEDLVRREVFEPLGMTHVGFGMTRPGQPFGHVDGHPGGPDNSNPPFFAPAGTSTCRSVVGRGSASTNWPGPRGAASCSSPRPTR